MQREADCLRRDGRRIVFVPTMGFFHAGHLSLMRLGRNHGDHLVVSIFVNPTQFGPGEDFDAYPRDLDRDFKMAESAGVDTVFAPAASAMYLQGYQTDVSMERLPRHLCGLSRPSHFCGVLSVVTKLFHIVKPHSAVFGEKDYQQLIIVRRMVKDLNFDIRIIGAPVARDDDGLAMSSRNSCLSREERMSAPVLFQALQGAQRLVGDGLRNSDEIVAMAREMILSRPGVRIDYVSICDPETLEDVSQVSRKALMALAVYVGKTRLIDNTILTPV